MVTLTRLALTLASCTILAVAGWTETTGSPFSLAARAAESRAYHGRAQYPSRPAETGPFTVVGSRSCRTCHRAIHAVWSHGPHARPVLARDLDQMLEPACKRCHAPLYDPDHPALISEVAVGCEACHGPGSEYSDLAVMIDPLKRSEAGLLEGQGSCESCHRPVHENHVELDLRAAALNIHPAPSIRRAPH